MPPNPQNNVDEAPLEADVVVEVRNTVVHDLVKRDPGVFEVVLAKGELDVTDTVAKVVGRLVGEYSKRSGKAHGEFEADEDNFPVQKYVRDFYVDDRSDFMALTTHMMSTLQAKASKTAASGGHVVFAKIYHQGFDQLVVAIVTEEWGAALGKNLELADTAILDLKGFRFAGRINLSDWANGGDKYISFLKGRSGEVSGYFKLFLGCDSSITDAAETHTLKNALESFAKESELDEEQRSDFFNKAYQLCSTLNKAGDPMELQVFANELWPADPVALMKVLARDEFKLTDGFIPDKRGLKAFVQFAAKTKTWQVKFERKAILDKDVVFNDDMESLTLFNLPTELKERLRKEMADVEEQDNNYE